MDNDKQLTINTEQEDNRIRAALLKDLNWDLDINSELFPLAKLSVMGTSSNDAKLNRALAMISYLGRKIEDQRALGDISGNGLNIFLHGFGRWGFAFCFTVLIAAMVFVHVYDSKHKVVISPVVTGTYQSVAKPIKKQKLKPRSRRWHSTDSTIGN